MKPFASLAAAALAACAALPDAPAPQDAFFARLQALCGQAFEGRVASAPTEADAAFADSRLVMHVRDCGPDEIRIPFHVGDNRSRTWVVTRTAEGLRLKHVHRHEDGSEDVLSNYGGDTAAPGTARRQEFPADAFSRSLFVRQGIPQSAANVWALEIEPGRAFAYELRRPGRHFRAEFDLSRPVAPP
ncbi:MAG: hypothetical protein M3N07_08735, partial [Pseudomonadota bacterium]|nr:hypothetical protein [Pseudomonadota bacterium]